MRYRITPGSIGAAWACQVLFGAERVDVGSWLSPIYVNDVKPEEVQPATELLAEQGLRFQLEGKQMMPGDMVWIDADTEEFGRVCGPATIIDTEEVKNGLPFTSAHRVVLVDAHTIKANIFIRSNEIGTANQKVWHEG